MDDIDFDKPLKEFMQIQMDKFLRNPEKHKTTLICLIINHIILVTTWCLLAFL